MLDVCSCSVLLLSSLLLVLLLLRFAWMLPDATDTVCC